MLKTRFRHAPNHVVPAWVAQRLGFSLNELRREDQLVYTDQTWLEVEVDKDWTAAARLAVQEGRVIVSELRVFPRDRELGAGVAGLWRGEVLGTHATVPVGGLKSELLRRVRIPKYAARARDVVESWRRAGGMAEESARVSLPGLAASTPGRRRTGRPDRFYAELAAEYVRTIEKGSRRPVEDIRTRRRLATAQVRDLIHEARERGFLSKGEQGAAGGYLLPKAEQLLGIRHRITRVPRKGTRPNKGR